MPANPKRRHFSRQAATTRSPKHHDCDSLLAHLTGSPNWLKVIALLAPKLPAILWALAALLASLGTCRGVAS
jgi:hypothetical protein